MLTRATPAAECKVCAKPFMRRNSLHTVCSTRCTLRAVYAKDKAERQERRETKKKLQDLEPLQYWLKRAETAVNRYVRMRDHDRGCISCALPASWDGRWNASHFRSVAAASAVRFCLWNIHKACYPCNQAKSGNIGEYAPRIRALIGDEKVDWLYTQNQRTNYTREYLERLERIFTKRGNRLMKRLNQREGLQ